MPVLEKEVNLHLLDTRDPIGQHIAGPVAITISEMKQPDHRGRDEYAKKSDHSGKIRPSSAALAVPPTIAEDKSVYHRSPFLMLPSAFPFQARNGTIPAPG